jgi:hypothetical protein
MRHRLFVAAVLAFVVAARVVLIFKGGQHFFFDETKLGPATEAAALLLKGRVGEALAYTVEPHPGVIADGFGYKLLGIAPALLEHRFGRSDRVPACFFSVFSALNVLILAGIARRLSGSRRAFDLTLVAAAFSATLLIYARFLLPYDESLCFVLLALWVGVRRPAGYLRSAAVGALAAWAFFCYFGHWPIVGVVVVLHALWLGRSPLGFAGRLGAAWLGMLAVVAAFYGVSRLGQGTLFSDIMTVARLQREGGADFRASLLAWSYMFDAEGLSLVIWTAAFAAALWLHLRPGAVRGDGLLSPLVLAAAGFVGVYTVFVVDSDIRQALIVYGRQFRQLVPFLILGFGLGMDRLCERARHGRAMAMAVSAALAANALSTFAIPFSQQFPRDFRARAQAVLRSRPPITDGASYYRLVNVDHFIVDPEVLLREPAETLLASRHPLLYLPYLYDGERSREKKRLRLSIDHRMRLVRMAVPEAERVRGDAYGMVTLSLEFPGGQAGQREPLLSAGPAGNGDLFFVAFPTDTTAELGFESMGQKVLGSEPFDFVPGARHSVQLFSGALMPAEGHLIAGEDPSAASALRQSVYAAIDGRTMIEAPMGRHASEPWEVYAGANTVGADSAGDQYNGRILGVTRGGLPPVHPAVGRAGEFGPVAVRFVPPPAGSGAPEPLVVVGFPGHAVLGYLRVRQDGTSVFGIEIWGMGAFESAPMSLARGEPVDVTYSFGTLYPGPGLPGWNQVPPEGQRRLLRGVRVVVNGGVAVDVQRDTPEIPNPPVYYGINPVGGSLVGLSFSGRILSAHREPVGE